MKPTIFKQAFHADILYLMRKEIEYLKSGADTLVEVDDHLFHRLQRHNDPFFVGIHEMITDRVSDWLGVKVKPSYVFTSMYAEGMGICPKHTDRDQCEYTFDICINQKEPWPINIASEDYVLEEGDAILYSGTNHVHYRNRIQPHNYCDLVFFHFVNAEFSGKLD
jgi:hypothetical protein